MHLSNLIMILGVSSVFAAPRVSRRQRRNPNNARLAGVGAAAAIPAASARVPPVNQQLVSPPVPLPGESFYPLADPLAVSPLVVSIPGGTYDLSYLQQYINAQAAAHAALQIAHANKVAEAQKAAASAANVAASAIAAGSTMTTITSPNGSTVNVATPPSEPRKFTINELDTLMRVLKAGQVAAAAPQPGPKQFTVTELESLLRLLKNGQLPPAPAQAAVPAAQSPSVQAQVRAARAARVAASRATRVPPPQPEEIFESFRDLI